MSELTTKRTLVKSPPELWAEVSDLEALAKHLGEFGEIRITRLEPETTVVWEGDRACGTVKLEASGWGTKVTLTAELAALEEAVAEEEPEPVEEPVVEEPVAVEEPPPPVIEPPRLGFWARMFRKRRQAEVPPAEPPAPDSEPPPVEEPEPDPEPAPVEEPPLPAAEEPFDGDRAVAVLTGVLDNLGAAHHRPFSRG
jgi:hypothetical protein